MIPVAAHRRSAAASRRVHAIAALAEALALDAFGFDPIDPVQLIDAIPELTWSQGSYGESFDGLIEFDGWDFHIYTNRDRCCRADAGRGAFTLGHELGHYFIDEHRLWLKANPHRSHCSFLFRPAQDERLHERDADVFACNLMLPAASFRKRVGNPEPDAEVILHVADHFRTSLTSTAIRFCELEPFPCAIIKWSERGACQWVRQSPRVQAHLPGVARSLDGPRAASATALALADGGMSSRLRSVIVPAATWFPGLEYASLPWGAAMESSRELTEQAIPLGRHGVITVLSSQAWAALPAGATTGMALCW